MSRAGYPQADKPIQHYYPEESSHCYGCGYSNPDGYRLRSYWHAGTATATATFVPRPYHTALPGYVYGGLIASLIDCHGTATAAAAFADTEGKTLAQAGPLRFVTAALNVDYRAPTPLGVELELTGRAAETGARKVVVDVTLLANDALCVEGRVVAVLLPDSMLAAAP